MENRNLEIMKTIRKTTLVELNLIEYLAGKAKYQLDLAWKEKIKVIPLTDEIIGSLRLTFDSTSDPSQDDCIEISNRMFYDKDGIPVAVYLLVNKENILCELDMWKGDYSPISEIPSTDRMMDIEQI